MKWEKRSKYHAKSECGKYTAAAYKVGDKLVYRLSSGGKFIGGTYANMREVSAEIEKPP